MREHEDLAHRALDRIGRRIESGPPRLSFAQERLWFLDRLVPDSPFYNVPAAIRIRTPIDPSVLRAAFAEIVGRHEVLRTAFSEVDGRPFQLIVPDVDVPLDVVDLQHLPPAAREREAVRLAELDARTPFDLRRVPLLRIGLVRLDADDHVFLVNLHHIAADGWSIGVLTEELRAIYEELAHGRPSPLPSLRIQYADFASWQRRRIERGVARGQLDYWLHRLADLPVLELPADFPRPAVQGFEGRTRFVTLPLELTQRLKQFSRTHRVTLFVTLLAAFNALLHRYTGQTDVVIGEPIANRNRVELEPLIGFFVNSLVLRTDVSGDPTFLELLGRSRDVVLEADANQDIPFELLVEHLKPERTLGRNPLFQVSLQFFSGAGAGTHSTVPVDAIHVDKGTASLDLALDLIDSEAGLIVRAEYSTELFTSGTIDSLILHYRTLLEAFVASPDVRISTPPMLEPAERERIVRVLGSGSSTANGRTLEPVSTWELFEQRVAAAPDAIALESSTGQWTYKELGETARRLAVRLRASGVGAETVVPICIERSPETIAGVLAVWLAGGAYLPFDPALPPSRMRFLVEDARPHVILTTTAHRDVVEPLAIPCLFVDDDTGAEAAAALVEHANLERLAYVIYTSGSTGAPKGVMVEHAALARHLRWMQDEFPLHPDDRILFKYSLNFDVSLLETVWPLLAGARVIIPTEPDATDANRVARLIRDHGITVLDVVPSMLAALLDSRAFGSATSLRQVFCGGEVMPPETLNRLRDRVDVPFANMYGPTEATITATYWCATQRTAPTPIPIGRPVGPTRVYVLDQALNPVPSLVAGELYVGGDSLARGYLRRPELTEERFVHDPFVPDPFARMYRTGDRCRFLPDGNLEFLGRVDEQVKVRGYRVELGEIERALASSPLVRSCAVALREDESGREELVAYIVLNSSAPELWPSVGEYFVYDDLLYYAMTNDRVRTDAYRAAIARKVKDKTVVDVGSGADLVLARMCLDAGAKRVYAIEMLDAAVDRARRLVQTLDLGERLVLVHGDSREVELPEKVDVSVSELIGTIGSSEGAVPLLNDARRFLQPGGEVIPLRCVTRVAAVCLPDDLALAPRFGEVASFYADRVFADRGTRFDVRVCVKNLPHDALLSAPAVFEELDFRHPLPEEDTTDIELVIHRDGRLDGLVLWIDLHVDAREQIDVLRSETSWLPIFLPTFSPPVEVCTGDVVSAVCSRLVASDELTPDYVLRGAVSREGQVLAEFDYTSARDENACGRNPFYVALLDSEPVDGATDHRADQRRVRDWQRLYDRLYEPADAGTPNPSFNTVGWNSSYTGLPISEPEMAEQVESAADRIRALGGKRLLEIGCGTGLLLFALAPGCERYTATDISGMAVEAVGVECRRRGLPQVEVLQRDADDFSGFEPGDFDGVVLNSVVQYFPSLDYLASVLAGATRVADEGWIFVGDVRNARQLEWLDAGIEIARADDDVPAEELRRRVRRRMANERELVLDPAFFAAWAAGEGAGSGVTVHLKRGRYHNELTKFRYDVVHHLGAARPAPPEWDEVAWKEVHDAATVAARVVSELPPALRLRGVPNARLAVERELLRTLRERDGSTSVAELRRHAGETVRTGIDPEDAWSAAAPSGYQIDVTLGDEGGEDGTFDVWWLGPAPDGQAWGMPETPRGSTRPWRAFAEARAAPTFDEGQLIAEFRSHMRSLLPEPLVPTRFVRLERLPMTSTGKVDRAALPAPGRLEAAASAVFVAPQGAVEGEVARVWSEILAVDRIGAETNFFDLGGHSLLATQVVSRLSAAFDVEIPLRIMFEHPTIRGVADAIAELQALELPAASSGETTDLAEARSEA